MHANKLIRFSIYEDTTNIDYDIWKNGSVYMLDEEYPLKLSLELSNLFYQTIQFKFSHIICQFMFESVLLYQGVWMGKKWQNGRIDVDDRCGVMPSLCWFFGICRMDSTDQP